MLIRIGRRRSAVETETFEEFLKVEFRDRRDNSIDLRPSVYETDGGDAELVRTHAEHAASFLMNPPRGGRHFRVSMLAERRVRGNPGTTRFRFTREQHREIVFDEESQARTFAAALFADLTERMCETALPQLRDYARGKLTSNDREWSEFAQDSSLSSDWKKLLGV